MSKTIVNLTIPMVVSKLEGILDTYPYHPYHQAFSIPELRQKLLSYVMSRIPGQYTVVEESEVPIENLRSLCCSLEQQQQIEQLIHQGIRKIFQEDSDWIDRHIPQDVNPSFAPSNWFG